MVQEILLRFAGSGRSKIVDYKVVLQVRSKLGELGSSQFSVVHHLYDLCESICNWQIVPHITKILQNFWLPLEKSERF